MLFATVFSGFAQQATQKIRGKVVDVASNAPLGFVNVALINTKFGSRTDAQGNFTIEDVPVGRYTIRLTLLGYETYVMKEVQVTSGKELYLNVSMKENYYSTSEIVVKPQVNKETAINSSATVSAKMLSVEEAQRYAGGFDDPARLVSSFAGVSSNVSNNSLVVRGNSSQSLQWKLEGVEIPNPNHFADLSSFGGGGLTALSSQLLANSDFFSGAMPAEYSNALSGVFDIFMRNGNNEKAEHTFQVGLLGIDFASEGPFSKSSSSSYLFNYRYSTLALLEPIMPENAGGTSYQDLSFKLNFITQNTGTFTLWGIGLIDGSGADAKKDTTEWKYEVDRENQDAKQYMGAIGISHTYFLNNNQFLKSTIAATVNGLNFKTDRLDDNSILFPKNRIDNQNYNFVFSSTLNTKFDAHHSNKSGIVATAMMYNLLLQSATPDGNSLSTIVAEEGFSTLISAYSASTVSLSSQLTMNIGINGQLFTLNNNYTIEPRLGLKYQATPIHSFSLAYGLHSRLEKLYFYFIKNENNLEINKNLDFTKAHHIVLGYGLSISETMHLKIEPYYQHLFSVPVIADSSFSMINMQNDWFFDGNLENTGTGRNFGLDITFEKYLSDNYYYMLTASLFKSQYKGGDGVPRDTRYDRNYVLNFLIGKEWMLGADNQNILGLNIQLSYQGGDRYSPINLAQSLDAREAIFDEQKAFSKQFAPAFTCHFAASYKINMLGKTHEIAIKMINATMYEEFTGFHFNRHTNVVVERREPLFFPYLSYKIEF
jgi:hypothetical protein